MLTFLFISTAPIHLTCMEYAQVWVYTCQCGSMHTRGSGCNPKWAGIAIGERYVDCIAKALLIMLVLYSVIIILLCKYS